MSNPSSTDTMLKTNVLLSIIILYQSIEVSNMFNSINPRCPMC